MMPERVWAWNFKREMQAREIKGGWTDEPDARDLKREQQYIRADVIGAEHDRLTGLIHERDQMLASYNAMLKESASREEHWKALYRAAIAAEQNKSET